MDLTIIGAFLDLAKKLYEPLRQYAKYRDGNQERIAAFCEKISECLGSMATAATEKKSVAAYTGELSTYMDSLMDLLEGLIPVSRLKEFNEKLNRATIQGRLVSELTDEASLTKAVNEIMEASGAFRGLSALLKIQKSEI
jgi:hypothetical protein